MEKFRLVDYFCVLGDLPSSTCLQQPFIADLEFRLTSNIPSSECAFTKYLEVLALEDSKLWLKVKYKSSETQDSLRKIDLFYLKVASEGIRVPKSTGMIPVPIVDSSDYETLGSDSKYTYYKGNFDLGSLFGFQEKAGYVLALTANYTSEDPPIVDLTVVTAQKTSTDKKVMNLPKDYQYITKGLGPQQNTFLCYKRQVPSLSVSSEIVNRYPREDYPDAPLNSALKLFVMNEVQLSKAWQSPKAFSTVLTSVDEASGKTSQTYVSALVFQEVVSEELKLKLDLKGDWYCSKAICLTSQWPFLDEFREILKKIYHISVSTYYLPIERVICNAVTEIPFPDQGRTAVQYQIADKCIYFSRPPPKSPRVVSHVSLEYLFRCLPAKQVVLLWSAAMLEKKLLLVSTRKSLLAHAAMALEGLLFPFKWQQVLIPVLPKALKSYVETIFPYIIGVHPGMLDHYTEVPYDTAKVDLDSGTLELPDFSPLPEKIYKRLLSRLQVFGEIYQSEDHLRDNADEAFNPTQEPSKFNPILVRDAFLEAQTQLLKGYKKYFKLPEESTRARAIHFFNAWGFLSKHKALKPNHFLHKLTETSMFANFIERRFVEPSSSHDLVFFDEAFSFKRNKLDAHYIEPHYPQEVVPAWQPNDSGINQEFKYSKFPLLNENYFYEPRHTRISDSQKPELKNLFNMSELEWAKFLLSSVYKLWFSVLSLTITKYKDQAKELMKVAFKVLEAMKREGSYPDEEVYRKLIESCSKCGLKDSALLLFEKMKQEGIEPNALTHQAYMASSEDTQTGSIALQEVIFSLEDNCSECGSTLTQTQIMAGWERSYSSYTTTCSFCKAKFVPKFTLCTESECFTVEFLSPAILAKEFQNLLHKEEVKQNISVLKSHQIVFWNLLVYFDLLKLPCLLVDKEAMSLISSPTKHKRGSKSISVTNGVTAQANQETSLSDDETLGTKWKKIFTRNDKKRNSIEKVFGDLAEDFKTENLMRSVSLEQESTEDTLSRRMEVMGFGSPINVNTKRVNP